MKKKLGDVFEIGSGGTPSKTHPEYYGGDIPWVKTGDLKSEYLYEVEDFITEEGLNNSSAKMYESDTVLIAMYGATIGATSILNFPACTNQACAAFKKSEEILPEYLYFFLRSKKEKFVNDGVGGTQPNISAGYLKKVQIEVRSLDEQSEIINVLDKVNRIIDERTKELAALDDLIKARFVEMFGDPVENPKRYYVATLQELIAKGYITYHLDGNHGGNYPKSEEFVDKGVPYISANCIVNGRIDFSKAKYLTPKRASKLRKGIAQNEDVLFAHNATVGPTVVLHTDEEKVILGTSLTAYRCNKNKVMPNYLKAYMLSDGFVRQYWGEMKQTTRNQVPITTQKKYLFLVPPIDLQNQFADFVNQVHKSKVEIQKALEKTQLLFDSLMQQYFG